MKKLNVARAQSRLKVQAAANWQTKPLKLQKQIQTLDKSLKVALSVTTQVLAALKPLKIVVDYATINDESGDDLMPNLGLFFELDMRRDNKFEPDEYAKFIKDLEAAFKKAGVKVVNKVNRNTDTFNLTTTSGYDAVFDFVVAEEGETTIIHEIALTVYLASS